MKIRRSLFLFIIFLILLIYALMFSIRSPFKDYFYPIIYRNIAKEIDIKTDPLLNTHIIHLKDGRKINAILLKETQDSYYIKEDFGYSGYVDTWLKKSDIQSLDSITTKNIPVSANEIIAKKLFPDFHIYRRDAYTFFSDASYFLIENTARELERLRDHIEQEFFEVIGTDKKTERICVVIFNNEEEYKRFAIRIDPTFKEAVGFYHPDYKMLFVSNMSSKKHKIDNITNTVRHEGAHQIFYSYGLHFGYGKVDRLWLVEGLAIYSEPSFRGWKLISNRRKNIEKSINSGDFIGLRELLKRREGFSSLHIDKMRLFYDESWSLVYFLMYRYPRQFMNFLKEIKAHPFLCLLKGDERLLEQTLGVSIDTLEQEFKTFCGR